MRVLGWGPRCWGWGISKWSLHLRGSFLMGSGAGAGVQAGLPGCLWPLEIIANTSILNAPPSLHTGPWMLVLCLEKRNSCKILLAGLYPLDTFLHLGLQNLPAPVASCLIFLPATVLKQSSCLARGCPPSHAAHALREDPSLWPCRAVWKGCGVPVKESSEDAEDEAPAVLPPPPAQLPHVWRGCAAPLCLWDSQGGH